MTCPAGPADDAYERKDYATALRIWTQLAEKNDPDAQIRIGGMYADGLGVARDYQAAANWFLRAARQGSARAQYNLGSMYYHGQGVRQSFEESARWILLAASRGMLLLLTRSAPCIRKGKEYPRTIRQH